MHCNTTKLSRREAIAAALAAMGATMITPGSTFADPASASKSASKSAMKIGCGTVNFRKIPLKEAMEHIHQAGYEYFEPQATGPWCPHVDVWKDDPAEFRRLGKEFGFKGATGLWSPHGAILPDAECVKGISQAIQWAKEAGIPAVFAGDGQKPADLSDADALKLLGERLAPIMEVAEKCGIYVGIEPHGTFSLTADGLLKILAVSKSKWLGINYDTANVHRATYVETVAGAYSWTPFGQRQDEVATLKAVVDRVVHVHVKDIVGTQCVALGTGSVNVLGCLDVLKQHGYQGALSLESEGEDSVDATQKIIETSKAFLEKAVNS
jgi:sugar phosphate isomerase/epimerase